jgi:GTPase
MPETSNSKIDPQKAFLVTVLHPGGLLYESKKSLDELRRLTLTLGLRPAGSEVVKIKKPSSRYLIGTGKTEEIIRQAENAGAEIIIFDDDLSPSQQRNWESLSDICVIDRHEVILDIFNARASTHESSMQVELARMEYSLPRLTRAWTHLSRQRGGARGNRGEGETQLEMDRRQVLQRIAKIKQELRRVGSRRETMRKRRERHQVPTGSLVGYTNAGKSSLLHAITDADLFIENKLFATLDPTTRRIDLPGGSEVLLTDTVGFIRKLPHDLVDAFKSTLEETVTADFLVHVIDASSREMMKHFATTLQVLEEIGAADKPVLTVFNKIDRIEDSSRLQILHRDYPGAVLLSAKSREGLEDLTTAIENTVFSSLVAVSCSLPTDRHDLVAMIHRTGRILEKEYLDGKIRLRAQVSPRTRNLLTEFTL